MYNNELYHYGVKGQKWGVRRYQRKDGSYTSAGKKRRATEAGYKAMKESWDNRKTSPGSNKFSSSLKALNSVNNAARRGYIDSVRADNAHNKQIRVDKKRAAKGLRQERQAYDLKRDNARFNQVKGAGKTLIKKGPRAAYKKTQTASYQKAKLDSEHLSRERRYLTPKDRDRLYQDVKSGKNYTTSYLKRSVSSTAKRRAAKTALKYGPTAAKTVAAVGAAYVAYRVKQQNGTMALPAHEILEATVHTVRNV